MHVRSHGAALPSWPPRPSICKSAPRRSCPRRHLHLRLQHAGDNLARHPHLRRHLHHAGDYLDTALVLPSSTRSRNRRLHQRRTEDKKQVKGARKSHGAPVHLRKCGRELLGLYTISYYDARRHLDARATWFHTQRSGDPIIIDSYFSLLASGAATPSSLTATSACSPAER